MTENQEQIDGLQTRLDRLVKTQIDFQREISNIRSELDRLNVRTPVPFPIADAVQVPASSMPFPPERAFTSPPVATPPFTPPFTPPTAQKVPPLFSQTDEETSGFSAKVDTLKDSARSDIEKFIGENLLSKVGIVILIIGIAIGAKFAIDQGWISPMVRIVFGYACGFALVGLAIRLKTKYLNFSSVLISGGMATMYFITYFAYDLYHLFNQVTAFSLMTIFTVFTVVAAINYSRQMIAHLGLVGAYSIPFLLSNNSGNYAFFFPISRS